MMIKKVIGFVAAVVAALGMEAAQPHVTTTKTYTGICTISAGTTEIWHIDPGGALVVNTDKPGNNYIEIISRNPSALWLEGGTITAGVLALRGGYSTYCQYSGTMTLTNPGGILVDAGTVQMYGGVYKGDVNFRKCAAATFQILGGEVIAGTFGGDCMKNADLTIAATNAYAFTGSPAKATFAITASTPISQAPKTLTISGTPVSGYAYALVNGITADTFFTATELTVPEGWQLLWRGQQLFLVETANLAVTAATWTGAAGDGNPRTPGNWTCYDEIGTVLEEMIPGFNTVAVVPAEATNFSFPLGQGIVLGELRFMGDQYVLDAPADWRGLDFSAVTRVPATIDVKGNVLKLSNEPASTPQINDLTVPGGAIRAKFLGNSTQHAGTPAGLVDNVVSGDNAARFLSGMFQGCMIDYDFGAGQGAIVRGVRFYCPSGPRRPKAYLVYGTMEDPAFAGDADWTLLDTRSNLNLTSGGWSAYLGFDNETPYRAYRIKVTQNIGSDQYGNYLEFYELELVREGRSFAAEVTSSVAGGELRFDVPANQYVEIAKTTLSGSLKVVQEGEGTLGFKKGNQPFTGGVEALAGIIRTQNAPGLWTFGGASTGDTSATTISLHEGTLLDLWAYGGWGYTTIVLDGGEITGRSDGFNPRLVLTAPSKIRATGDFNAAWQLEDLGGQTLTLDVAAMTHFVLNQSRVSNGVLDIISGGWFVSKAELDAHTVDLKMNAALRIEADLSVHDYDAKYANYYNEGTGELKVFGTFTPRTAYFYGCTLQDGATIDLSAKTNEWLTTSQSDGRRVCGFAANATMTLALGARRPVRGERIVHWREAPATMDSLAFAFSFDDPSVAAEPAIVTPTGVFYGCEPSVVDRAYWTGAVDGDVTNPANWACTNVVNEGVADAVPGAVTTIHLANACAMNVPAESPLAYSWVICDAPLALTADCDWRGIDLSRIADGAVIDLCGHRLWVSGNNGETVRALTVTNSTTAPGELHVDVAFGQDFFSSTISIEGNTRFVKEGEGVYRVLRDHQAYTGGTEIVKGRILLDTSIDPLAWPLGGDGILDPSAMTITVHEGGSFYPSGKTNWANATIVLDGGTLEDWSAGFNAKLVFTDDSTLDVFSGNFVIPASADFCDLGGKTLTVKIQSGKGLYLNQTELKNGAIDILNGGWLFFQAPLDAQTVDFHVGCALTVNADLTVHDYEAKYVANYNEGTNVLTVCGTFTPTTDYFYGCTLANGARIDLSSKTNVWSTTSAFTTAGRKVLSFAPGAKVGVILGDRRLEDEEQVISWTAATAPEGTQAIKFKPVDRIGSLYMKEDGVYFRKSSFVIMIR